MNKKSLRWYFHLFDYIAENRIKNNDLEKRDIHSHLVIVLTTGILMWGYAFVAYFYISSKVPGYVGLACAVVHMLSPLIFRVSHDKYLATNTLICAGMIHQATYSFYTGGFESHLLIWFGILPMIGGVICGIKGAVTWAVCTTLVSVTYLILYLNGFIFPNEISTNGRILSQAMLVFGWIFLSSSIVIVYSSLRANAESLLREQGQKIEDLFRVLFHDLANPLGRVSIGISLAKRSIPQGETNRGLDIANSAVDSMLGITQNVRKMYAVSKGKANVDLSLCPLHHAVEYVHNIYASELERKKIKLNFNKNSIGNVFILVDSVSFNNQVLGNVIQNAIKFSPEGGEIDIIATQIVPGKITVEVRDYGIGIPSELLPHLFNINKKTSRPGTSGETGTGFGMPIMKSFVEMYGGEIFVESPEGSAGTTVRLILKGEMR